MIHTFLFLCLVILNTVNATHVDLDWDATRPAFNPEIYESALDPEICREQLQYIRGNSGLRFKFLEAGMKLPRGFHELNFVDWGMYDTCLEINEDIDTSVIRGKYCQIRLSLNSNNNFMEMAHAMNWDVDPSLLNDVNLVKFDQIQKTQSKLEAVMRGMDLSRTISRNDSLVLPPLTLALCIPKTCTTGEGMSGLLFNITWLGFRFQDNYCRFVGDKPWVPADYVAIVIFSLFGLLAIVSTSYDVCHLFIFKKDPKTANALYRSFSIYTNGKRLTTFTHNPNNLYCVDGIRSISMFWIVAGHTILLTPAQINTRYVYTDYLFSLKSLWVTAAPFTVDTFLLLAGMLLVYTTVGKLTGRNLLKNLHMFYINRLLRMFPLLAALILLQASLLHKIADGPDWTLNEENTNNCRNYWWAALLYVQNYVNVKDQCLNHSWYLAIDIQCYLVSPIILYWVLNKENKKQAWSALTFGVLASLIICTVFSFIGKFPGWLLQSNLRPDGEPEYHLYYYFNTLTRSPPFFLGMLFGYILYTWKGRQPEIPRSINLLMWILSGGTMLTLMYVTHLMKDASWDYWTIDDLMNSWSRTVWAAAIGWIIFACQHGYGGPINWFLCLDIWKLPSRISYAIYLFHYHIQFVIRGAARQLVFFSDSFALYNFCSQVLIAYGVAFAATLFIDSPCSNLIKLMIGEGPKKKPPPKEMKNVSENAKEKEIAYSDASKL